MGARSVYGVMCTFRRPAAVRRGLDAVAAQSLVPDLVVVVDNDDDPTVRRIVESHEGVEALYLGVRPNCGPAGAFNIGLVALPEPDDDDLVVLFDDDDPPVDPGSLRRLVAQIDRLHDQGAPIGGVGLHGALLDLGRGRVRPPVGDRGLLPVDHLHGGYLPVYRRSALRAVGGFDPDLFWGFEELDLGRRLTRRGLGLLVDADHWQDVADRYPKASSRRGLRFSIAAPTPARYYGLRNLLRILRRERAWAAIVHVVLTRGLGKPVVGLLVRPRASVSHLVVNLLAIADAARGRMGQRTRFHGLCGFGPTGVIPGRDDSEQLDVAQAEEHLGASGSVGRERAHHQRRAEAG